MQPFAGEPVPVEAEVALFQGALDLRIDLVKAHIQTIGKTGDVSQIHCRLIERELELSLLNRLPAETLCRVSVAINGAAPSPMVIGPQNALIPIEGTEISMRICRYA